MNHRSTDVGSLLSKLSGVEGTSPEWKALCPLHDDKDTKSLHITLTDNGKVLLFCHGGCSAKMGNEAFARAIFTRTNPFPTRDRISSAKKKGIFDCSYDYLDAKGNLVFQVLRFKDPKGFSQRRPDPRSPDDWINMLGQPKDRPDVEPITEKPIYRLPAILALPTTEPVFVVEGEKDADTLWSLDIPATTSSGGAEKWKPNNTQELAGRPVVIIPDNNDVGHSHASMVASSLREVCPTVEICLLPRVYIDVTDYLNDESGTGKANTSTDLLALPRVNSLSFIGHEGGVPTILIRPKVAEIADEAEAAMLKLPDHGGLYQRSNEIVRLVRAKGDEKNLKYEKGTPFIQVVPDASIREILSIAADFTKENARGIREDLPPDWLVATIRDRGSHPFREVDGFSEVPVIRDDGTVLDAPGYDPILRMIYEPIGGAIVLPERPTLEDAQEALSVLWDPFCDFPFGSPEARSAAIASLFTMLRRHTITGPVPMFAVRASAPGVGKGKLVRSMSLIATGREPATCRYCDDDDEMAKQITTIVMQGSRSVLLDEVKGMVESTSLQTLATTPTWMGRILGLSKMVNLRVSSTFFLCGNNIGFSGDMPRRVIPVDLESNVEFPEDRQGFKYPDLEDHVRKHRTELLAAALTIVRAFCLAGSPKHQLPRPGSFEAWDDQVRALVLWLGQPDPDLVRRHLREESDTDSDASKEFFAQLLKTFSDLTFTPKEIAQKCESNPDLLDACVAAAPRMSQHAKCSLSGIHSVDVISATKSLKYALRKFKGRISGSLKLVQESVVNGVRQWQIRSIENAPCGP